MLLTAIYVQLILLSITYIWFVIVRRRSNFDLIFKSLAITALLAGLWLGSVWLYPPYWGLGLVALSFLSVALVKFFRPPQATSRLRAALSNIPILLILPLGLYLGTLGYLGRGQSPEGLSVNLSAPFKPEQNACVMSGGLNGLLNQHNFSSNAPGDISQIYGLDIVRKGAFGFRTIPGYRTNPKPKRPEQYNMFDTKVYAPCAGKVVWSENTYADLPIGRREKNWTSGNGVTLACGRFHIKLSHMKKGSVRVELGDQVESGQVLGRIGNSGNTEEPHLHIHAETIIERGNPWTHGQPVHMVFNGHLMSRGDCF